MEIDARWNNRIFLRAIMGMFATISVLCCKRYSYEKNPPKFQVLMDATVRHEGVIW